MNGDAVTMTMISNIPPGSTLPMGSNKVVYQAKDQNTGATSECTFYVDIKQPGSIPEVQPNSHNTMS